MNIAFDIDGVFLDIDKFIKENGRKYFKKQIVNEKGFTVQEIFNVTKQQEKKFWKKYLYKYVKNCELRKNSIEVLQKLYNENFNIYVITSRVFSTKTNFFGIIMRKITKDRFKKFNIKFKNIIFCKESKVNEIRLNSIKIMVEDSPENIENLKKYTKMICFNTTYNTNVDDKNVKRVNSFEEVYTVILDIKEDIENRRNKLIEEFDNKKKTNLLSVDKPWLKHYLGDVEYWDEPRKTIYEYLYEINKDRSYLTALTYFNKKTSYKKMFDIIDKTAASFTKLGIKKGDYVTICMPNTPEGIITFYALNKIGAISNLIHPLSSENEIKKYLNEVNCKTILTIDLCLGKIDNIVKKTKVKNIIKVSIKDSMPIYLKFILTIVLLKNKKKYKNMNQINILTWKKFLNLGNNVKIKTNEYVEDDKCVMLHTGGTSGSSKGVLLTNENFTALSEQIRIILPSCTSGDKMLAVAPIFHGLGIGNSIFASHICGYNCILVPLFNKKKFHKLLLNQKPNIIAGVPTIFEAMTSNPKFANKDLSFLKYIISGGDSLPENLEIKFNKFLETHNCNSKISKGYGLTETLAAVCSSYKDSNLPNSIGIPMYKNNFKIVTPGTSNEVKIGEKGEICVFGKTVMIDNYYKDNDDIVIQKHKDGLRWFHTGDMGYADNDGNIYYLQRISRMFVSSGYNIYPGEIEKLVLNNKLIDSCLVIGVKNNYKMKEIKLYIKLHNEIDKDVVFDQLKKLFKENLPKYSIPKSIELIDEFPKTKLGKLDYKTLEKQMTK